MTPPDENAWDAWSPEQLAAKLGGVNADWYIVGGWALDLWLGAQRREHEDLEFATTPTGAPIVASYLKELTFFEAKKGQMRKWNLNIHVDTDTWQFWGADLGDAQWRVDMMIERGTPAMWSYKRHPDLKQPRDQAIQTTADGIRYLAPANVLLFKAKHCRAKDEDDFEAALPRLTIKDRVNLRDWLGLYHPDHKWLHRLM